MTLKERKAENVCNELMRRIDKEYERLSARFDSLYNGEIQNSAINRKKLKDLCGLAFINVTRFSNISRCYDLRCKGKETVFTNRLQLIFSNI